MREVSREEYQKLLESKIREIEHDFERYLTTVTLFHSIWDFFNRTRKFVVDIEPTLKLGDNRFVRPDIVFYDPREETILLIIEYKFGIKGSEEHLIEDLKNVEKYLQLVPDVILLFSDINSENERRKLWRIISKLDKRLIIWNALLDNEKQVIIFEKIKGEPKCKKFMNILKSKKFKIPLQVVSSFRHSFIREKPPEAYAAYRLWPILLTLVTHKELYYEKEVELTFQEVQEELNKVFPPWVSHIANIQQLQESVFRRAIGLLEYAEFIEVDWKEKLIKVKTNKRIGSDLKELFIKKAAERYLKERQKIKIKKEEKKSKGDLTKWVRIKKK
jgi:hypothetical protein